MIAAAASIDGGSSAGFREAKDTWISILKKIGEIKCTVCQGFGHIEESCSSRLRLEEIAETHPQWE